MNSFSSQLRDLNVLVSLGNVADKAYNEGEGTPEKHVPFGPGATSSVQNNAITAKAVASATLLIAAYREKNDEPSMTARVTALQDIVGGNLTAVECLVCRVLGNATWWGRAISRDISRITNNDNGGDFQDLSYKEKVKDDTVMKPVAAAMMEILDG